MRFYVEYKITLSKIWRGKTISQNGGIMYDFNDERKRVERTSNNKSRRLNIHDARDLPNSELNRSNSKNQIRWIKMW